MLVRLGFAFVAAASAMATVPVASADSVDQAMSPSGNIVCAVGILAPDPTAYADCEIAEHNWSPPPRPGGCEQDYGSRVLMIEGRPPTFPCYGDTLRGNGLPTLNYGQTISARSITCLSQPSGMRCEDSSTGHNFTLSRESYDLN